MQQDSFLVLPQILHNNTSLTDETHFDDSNAALFTVADGMGGGAHGEIASGLVTDGLREYVLTHKDQLPAHTYSMVNGAIYHANQKILDHLSMHPDDLSMGSTVILGLIQDEILNLGWVGDSRCYVLQNNDELLRLSHDHSFVQSLVDEGKITEEEAFDHPNRNIIHQSMGMASILPSFEKIQLDHCKFILLCSDGLNSMLRDEEIKTLLTQEGNVEHINQKLVNAANQAGGEDNITSILISLYPVKNEASIRTAQVVPVIDPVKKGFPWLLLIIGICLTVLFIVAFNFQTKNTSEIKEVESDSINKISIAEAPLTTQNAITSDSTLTVENAYYYIRLKVFSNKTLADTFLRSLEKESLQSSYEIRKTNDGLFEVCLTDFESKESALQFLQNGLYPDAVILYKK